MSDEWDVVHAHPERKDTHKRTVPGRFDTVIIDAGKDTAQYSGVDGYIVGQVKVIFTIPQNIFAQYNITDRPQPRYLAYVEWFTRFPKEPNPDHRMYRIKRVREDGDNLATVIPLSNIRRSIHLFPNFGKKKPHAWTSSNVLDLAESFFVSDLSDRHAFQTII